MAIDLYENGPGTPNEDFDPWQNPELNADPRFPRSKPRGVGAEGVPDKPAGLDAQSWFFLNKYGIEHPRQAGLPQGPEDWASKQAAEIGGWQAPGQYGVGDYRARGRSLLETLAAKMRGEGLEATRQGQAARASSRSDLLSHMASTSGSNVGARRDAAYNAAGASQGIRGQEAVAAEREKQMARDLYGDELARQWAAESGDASRRQDFTLGREQARQGMLGMGLDDIAARYGQYEDYLAGQGANLLARKKLVQQKNAEEEARQASGIQTAATIASFGLSKPLSDVRAKKNIRPARSEGAAILDALVAEDERSARDFRTGQRLGEQPGKSVAAALGREGPLSWDYKEGFGTDERRVGPMAQTLEKVAPGAVVKGKDGMRRIEPAGYMGALATAIAEQQRQLDEMKKAPYLGAHPPGDVPTSPVRDFRVLGAAPAVPGGPIGAGLYAPRGTYVETGEPEIIRRPATRLPPADVLALTGGDPWGLEVSRRRR